MAIRTAPKKQEPAIERALPVRDKRPKVPVTIRLDADLADAWKATGKGWQTRLNAALRSVKPFGE